VDEVPDEGDAQPIWTTPFPAEDKAGGTFGRAQTSFEALRDYQQRENLLPWAPFKTKADWKLARWFIKEGPSQSSMDNLLKLESVRRTEPEHENEKLNNPVDDGWRKAWLQKLPLTLTACRCTTTGSRLDV
jgi:hypothetical protein